MTSKIHPTAIVDPDAELGKNVTIGPFAIIERDTLIGDNTQIHSHVLIAEGARIGEQCRIHKGAVVATVPQDLKFGGEKSTFEIGDHTVIREFCTLNRGTKERGKSTVGKHCLLMAYTHVAHDCLIGDHAIIANGVQIAGHVTIEDWVIIGGMTPIHQFCKVGQHAMVGGAYRVVQDIPPFILASGEPMRFAGLNSIGLRRRGFSPEVRKTLKDTYRLLYRSNLNVSQAVDRIKHDIRIIPEVQAVLDFIKDSDRGIIR